MIRVVIDFAVEGIVGREIFHPKAKDPALAYVEAVSKWEDQLIAAGFATFECDCCIDAYTAHLELYHIALYKDGELIILYPVDTVID